MKNTGTEIGSLVTKFSDKFLLKSEWTHRAHIIVGLWHIMNYDFESALSLMHSKIKAYNISIGTLNTDDSGYHETLTLFWMTVVKGFVMDHPSLPIEVLFKKIYGE